jgi:hypothetical protein
MLPRGDERAAITRKPMNQGQASQPASTEFRRSNGWVCCGESEKTTRPKTSVMPKDWLPIIVVFAVVVVLVFGWLLAVWRDKRGAQGTALPEFGETGDDRQVTREFKNVFFNLTEVDRERIISALIKRSRCTRTEAMRLAIDDWRKDQLTWR